MTESIEIIAHRGYSAAAPENTVAAIHAAAEAGADAVEFDVHSASCGTPVLFHDTMLGRTSNGVGPVQRRTLRQLKALDAGSWFSPEFAGERIPSLREALEATRGRFGRAYVEVKGFRELEDVDRMVRIVRDVDMLDQAVFISLNWTILARVRGLDRTVSIGYVVEDQHRVEEAFDSARDDEHAVLDLKADLVLEQPGLVERARSQGNDMAVWTVDDAATATQLTDRGVYRITTNEVERLLEWRTEGAA